MQIKFILKLLVVALLNAAGFAETTAFKEKYSGGSLSGIKIGYDLDVGIVADRISFTRKHVSLVTIPASAVTGITYGQDVHRRIGTSHWSGSNILRSGRAYDVL